MGGIARKYGLVLALSLFILFSYLLLSGVQNQEHFESVLESKSKFNKPVFMIILDGCRPDKLSSANTPNMDFLISKGSAHIVETVNPSSTLPAHASIVTGVPPEVHGITWNKERGVGPKVKTIFELHPGKSAFLGAKKKLSDAARGADISDFTLTDSKGVMNEAISLLSKGNISFMLISLPDIDRAGHKYGSGSREYIEAIEGEDALIGGLIEALNASYGLSNTVIIITSDHGMTGTAHGTKRRTDMEVPLILFGHEKVEIEYNYEILNEIT